MKIKLYQVDAFTDNLFSGNPAAVCPLHSWPNDSLLQQIAMENNLAETVFFVKNQDLYHIRWFTPAVEVNLCGHATLAAAFILFNYLNFSGNEITFQSRSGILKARRENGLITLNFPADRFEKVALTPDLAAGFNIKPTEAYRGKTNYMLIFENEEDIKNLQPDFRLISKAGGDGVIVTAPGKEVDFVSRFFAPFIGIDEDPVTGSAHTTLTPYWAGILGKTTFRAIQLSARKGHLQCKLLADRVELSGNACLYLEGEIEINQPA